MKKTLALAALLALCACEKKPAPPLPEPPPPPPTPLAFAPPPAAAPGEFVGALRQKTITAAPSDAQVVAPAEVNLDPRELENQRVKEEVLKRIDLMPGLSPVDKDKLYVQVQRARAMGKVITIPFPSGRTALDEASAKSIGEKLQLEQIRKLAEDPTVVFVVLGYADKKGDPGKNEEISLARANAVLNVLQNKFRLLNVMHSVGMGSSEMFDAQNLDKNRVVELWAVLP